MNATNLKRRKNIWFARALVPKSLQPVVGKSEVLRTLGTGDLREANQRKHAVLDAIYKEWAALTTQPIRGTDEAQRIADEARSLIAEVKAGRMSAEDAEAALDAAVENFTDRRIKEVGTDEDGDANLPADEAAAIRTAYKVIAGNDAELLSTATRDYLRETEARVTKAAQHAKIRRLKQFSTWLGADRDVRDVTRRDAGRYVSECLLTKGNTPKTTKDHIADLSAFWNWLVVRGAADANVWHRMTSSVKGSTRGKEAGRRPWTDDELNKLLEGLRDDKRLYPLAAIAAYSGMRIEEIAKLRVGDVTKDNALVIREGKTAAAVRRVPIHPTIAPLVRHLRDTSTDGFLIPGAKPGGYDSKRSHYLSRAFGFAKKRLGFTDKALVFHTLRNSFMQRCENAGVPESTVKLIVGHSRQGSMTYGLYSPGPNFEKLREGVRRVTYGKADRSMTRPR